MSFRIYAVHESAMLGIARDDRRASRAPCGGTVHAVDEHAFGFCSDLSLGGMLFIGPELPVARRVALRLQLPEAGMVLVEGEVIGHRAHQGAAASVVRFPHLNAKTLRVISRFLASRLNGVSGVTPASA